MAAPWLMQKGGAKYCICTCCIILQVQERPRDPGHDQPHRGVPAQRDPRVRESTTQGTVQHTSHVTFCCRPEQSRLNRSSAAACPCAAPCIMYHVSCIMYHVSCIMYHVSCIMYHVSCIMYHVSCIMYHVSCIMYHVSCIMYHVSCIMYHVSCIMYHVSCIMYHVSCIMYHVSYVSCIMYHVSCVMCHVSCIMYHVSYILPPTLCAAPLALGCAGQPQDDHGGPFHPQ